MYITLRQLTAGLAAASVICAAHAEERGTRAEAMAMVDAGLVLIKSAGPDKAARDFMSEPRWKQKDLYISMYQIRDSRVTVVAHGMNDKLVGKDITELKDADGKAFIREAATIAAKGGWVDYKWPDPATRKVNEKTSYIRSLPGSEYAILVGVYK